MSIELRRGTTRCVILVGSLAIEIPQLWPFAKIPERMRGNWFERLVMRRYAKPFRWDPFLCPIMFADRIGLVVVMPRARAATREDRDRHRARDEDLRPMHPAEEKPEDWGWLPDGRFVALDYASPALFEDSMRERIRYLEKMLASLPPL